MSLFTKYQAISRKRKFDLFMEVFRPDKDTKILDCGCGEGTFLEEMYPFKENITGMDISAHNVSKFKLRHPSIKIIRGNAKSMQFGDKEFDIVFSNAVIEHVGSFNEQKKFANEIMRVGKAFFITTPNYWFPFEPHYRLPLFQFIPKSIQRFIAERIALGNYENKGWEDINLLSYNQLKRLFNGATIIKQRVTFMPETLLAVGI